MTYPPNWPRCLCGEPVLDGHLTCGRAACDEGAARELASGEWLIGRRVHLSHVWPRRVESHWRNLLRVRTRGVLVMSDGRVKCGKHGWVNGFIVCVHVLAGAKVAHRIEPTGQPAPDGLGEILCLPCHLRLGDLNVDDLKLICSRCVDVHVVGRN